MSIAQKGKKRSPEVREIIRLASIGRGVGRKNTPETIAKMREKAQKTAKHVVVGDTHYNSISDAAKAHGISHCTVHQRIQSTTRKFQEWRFS